MEFILTVIFKSDDMLAEFPDLEAFAYGMFGETSIQYSFSNKEGALTVTASNQISIQTYAPKKSLIDAATELPALKKFLNGWCANQKKKGVKCAIVGVKFTTLKGKTDREKIKQTLEIIESL